MRRFFCKTELRRLLNAREGATAIEYAIIAAGIATAIIATVGTLGVKVTGLYTSVADLF